MADHKYRFGVNGNALNSFFKKRKVKEKRIFPKVFNNYVDTYYKENKLAGYCIFIGH